MYVFVILLAAVLIWWWAVRLRQSSGLPRGEVVYTDTGGWGRLEQPLFSLRLQLAGKPDYLVRAETGYIPVEVKSGRAPAAGAHAAHLYQLAAYCALVTEAYGQRPPYGLIKYADKTLKIEYTRALEADLLQVLGEMRADADADEVARSHESAARCRGCGFREACDEALASGR